MAARGPRDYSKVRLAPLSSYKKLYAAFFRADTVKSGIC